MPLKGNEARVYSVHERSQHPQFISTNRHIMQGMMELLDVKWDEVTRVYSGSADVVAGEDTQLDAAIEFLLNQLKNSGGKWDIPGTPTYPDKSKPGMSKTNN